MQPREILEGPANRASQLSDLWEIIPFKSRIIERSRISTFDETVKSSRIRFTIETGYKSFKRPRKPEMFFFNFIFCSVNININISRERIVLLLPRFIRIQYLFCMQIRNSFTHSVSRRSIIDASDACNCPTQLRHFPFCLSQKLTFAKLHVTAAVGEISSCYTPVYNVTCTRRIYNIERTIAITVFNRIPDFRQRKMCRILKSYAESI